MFTTETINGFKKTLYNGKPYVKIGTAELYEDEAAAAYDKGEYLLTYSAIYQIFYSAASDQFYGRAVYRSPGLIGKGRHMFVTAAHANRLIGFNHLA